MNQLLAGVVLLLALSSRLAFHSVGVGVRHTGEEEEEEEEGLGSYSIMLLDTLLC